MEIKNKAEKTKSNIEQLEPICDSRGITDGAGSTNRSSSTPTLLERYITGWRKHDTESIIATLTPDCVITESFGPIYHGHTWVRRWISAWFAENGRVIDWTIQDLQSSGNVETAEWTFTYTWRGEAKSFEGITIAKIYEGKILNLREYATTAPLYNWQGDWLPL